MPGEIAPRFRPTLAEVPLTQARTLAAGASAAQVLAPTGYALPSRMHLNSVLGPNPLEWTPLFDLLETGPFDTNFVAEVESDGRATIRFGDDDFGMRPDAGTVFEAQYRVGNGRAGNIGRDSLLHVALAEPMIVAVRNPLHGMGGIDPETIEEVRQRAPFAFRRQERAVTRDDYREIPLRMGGIQGARGTWRHTGSWHTIFVTADRAGGLPVDDAFAGQLRDFLEVYRLAGRDLAVDQPHDVPLELELTVCVLSDYFRADVARDLVALFSNRRLPDGRLGLFHPDRFTFGQTVYLSPLIAVAQSLAGVASVEATVFRRLGDCFRRGSYGRVPDFRQDRDRAPRQRSEFPGTGLFQLHMLGGK